MKAKQWIYILFLSLICTGCTHNNGDIGPWFGTWKLEEITVNGVTDTSYGNDILWKFQSSIICIVRVEPYHERSEAWGTWSQDGNALELNYTYTDDKNSAHYVPLPETYIPAGVTVMSIEELSGSKLKLIYHAADGNIYGYKFKKW